MARDSAAQQANQNQGAEIPTFLHRSLAQQRTPPPPFKNALKAIHKSVKCAGSWAAICYDVGLGLEGARWGSGLNGCFKAPVTIANVGCRRGLSVSRKLGSGKSAAFSLDVPTGRGDRSASPPGFSAPRFSKIFRPGNTHSPSPPLPKWDSLSKNHLGFTFHSDSGQNETQ
jgi:hypothetical protein